MPTHPSIDALKIDRSATKPTPRWPWFLLLLVPLFAVAGFFIAQRAATVEVTTQPVIEQSASSPSSTSTAPSASTLLNASGYVTARRMATVSAKVTGRIDQVLVEEGMQVEEDQILARLDPVNIERILDLTRARLESAKSALEETRIRKLEAQREYDRIQQLTSGRIASDSEFDRAEASLNSLTARLAQQEAEIAVADRQVAVSEQDLDDLIIRAPFKGVVVSKDAQPGEMISPISAGGAFTRTGICTIVDMDSLEIEVDVNEAYINRVTPGQTVSALLNAYPDWTIPCRVIAIIPTADRQKATFRVRIGFNQLDPRILPEMGVKVGFQGAPATSASGNSKRRLAIPASAVFKNEGRDTVWIVADGRLSRKAIVLEGTNAGVAYIESGLLAGERVVVSEQNDLKEGQRAREKSS